MRYKCTNVISLWTWCWLVEFVWSFANGFCCHHTSGKTHHCTKKSRGGTCMTLSRIKTLVSQISRMPTIHKRLQMKRAPSVFWHCGNISHMIFLVRQYQCPDRTRQEIRTIETSDVANLMGLQHGYIFWSLNWEVGTPTFQNWKCQIIKWTFKKLQSGSKCGTRTVILTNIFVCTYLQISTKSLDTMISEEPM